MRFLGTTARPVLTLVQKYMGQKCLLVSWVKNTNLNKRLAWRFGWKKYTGNQLYVAENLGTPIRLS